MKRLPDPPADVYVGPEGSDLMRFRAATDAAKLWVEEETGIPGFADWVASWAIPNRNAEDVMRRMENDGLSIEVGR